MMIKLDNDMVIDLERILQWYNLGFDGVITNKEDWVMCEMAYNSTVIRKKKWGA